MIRLIFICCLCLSLTGCMHQVSPLEKALELSGSNRIHLEQVLKHYSQSSKDTLKLRTARFLIENMPGHGWYEGDDLIQFKKWVDSVYSNREYPFRATLYEAYFQQPDAFHGLTYYEDIEHLDSTFLITHIDSTFSAIQKRPWLTTLTFDELCEYIFPYRVGYEPPTLLYELQDSIYRTQILPILHFDDIRYNTYHLFNACQSRYAKRDMKVQIQYKGKIISYNIASCEAECLNQLWFAKLLMCPLAVDFNPAYPNRLNRHCWYAVIDNTQNNGTRDIDTDSFKQGKIYRKSYTHTPVPISESTDFVPPLFKKPFYKDVTAFYTSVKDVVIKLDKKYRQKYAYLCVFNDLKWEPVAYSEQKDGKFHFKDMGKGVLYLPVVYEKLDASPISHPFVIDLQGKIHYFIPDTSSMRSISLTRKFPLRNGIEIINKGFLSSKLEASNNLSFDPKEHIGSFEKISSHQRASLLIKNSQSYRYWRITSSAYLALGECHLYDSEGEKYIPIITSTIEKAFDNDPISYYKNPKGFITIDMGKDVTLSKIEVTLRNDGNGIWPGHWYELYYHDGCEWRSLGLKAATGYSISFDGVPDNALLWLRDLTTGKEESLFSVEEGEIRFW